MTEFEVLRKILIELRVINRALSRLGTDRLNNWRQLESGLLKDEVIEEMVGTDE